MNQYPSDSNIWTALIGQQLGNSWAIAGQQLGNSWAIILLMSESEWGRLARLQDEVVRSQDRRQQHRHLTQQLLYKQELEQMIQQKKAQKQAFQEQQKYFYHDLYQAASQSPSASPQQLKFDRMLKDSAQYNLSIGRERRQRVKSEAQSEKHALTDCYRKVETELSEERQRTVDQKEQARRRLAVSYEEQMSREASKRTMERMEDHKFEEAAHQLEQRREQERMRHINKIRFGFAQNPESYQLVDQIYRSREAQQQDFLHKLERSRIEDTSQERMRERQLHQTIETSTFNRMHHLEKQLRRKQLQQKDLEEEQAKIGRIQAELEREEERAREKRQRDRRMLRTELEHQIEEHGDNISRSKGMSQNQSKINQQFLLKAQEPKLPGMTKDYRDARREQLIDSFLGGPSCRITPRGPHSHSQPSALQSLSLK